MHVISFAFVFSILFGSALVLAQTQPPCKVVDQHVGYINGQDEAFIDSLVSKRFQEQLSPLAQPKPLKPLFIENLNPLHQSYYRGINSTQYLVEDAAYYAISMIRKAYDNGVRLFVHSAYRSYQQQCEVFRSKVLAEIKSKKINVTDAILSVNQRSAFPGESEHQLATTMDLVSNEGESKYALTYHFEKTRAYEWLQANAVEFGYALSYPKPPAGDVDKPHPQTQIIFEPWHWRFIGLPAAREFKICSEKMTLQQFLREVKNDAQFNCR